MPTTSQAARNATKPVAPRKRIATGRSRAQSSNRDKGGPAPKLPKGFLATVAEVRAKMGLSQLEYGRVTGYSLRSVAGWEGGKPLSEPARQKLIETDRLRVALSGLLPAGELGEWMRTPNPAFEGQSPIQVIENGEADRLWRMIFQIDAGVAN